MQGISSYLMTGGVVAGVLATIATYIVGAGWAWRYAEERRWREVTPSAIFWPVTLIVAIFGSGVVKVSRWLFALTERRDKTIPKARVVRGGEGCS